MDRTAIRAWLSEQGLERYAGGFEAQDIDLETLPSRKDSDLRELGVDSLGHRKRILSAIEGLPRNRADGSAVVSPTVRTVPHTIAELPSILAVPLQAHFVEANPVLALWSACDAVEMACRFAVMAGIAELRRANPLAPDLLNELRPRIEEPTLGKWRGMAEAIARRLVGVNLVLPELAPFVMRDLVALLDGPVSDRSPESSLSALRNRLAHGGGMTQANAARLSQLWRPRMATFLEQIRWMTDLRLVVRTPDGAGVLRGPTATPVDIPPEATIGELFEVGALATNKAMLLRGSEALLLWPLTIFGAPRTADSEGATSSEWVLQVYARRGEVQLQLTPVGSDLVAVSESDESALEAFMTLFRPREGKEGEHTARHEVRGFEGDLRRDASRLIGRGAELERVKSSLTQITEGVLWLGGMAGVGKSTVFARLAVDLLDDPPDGALVFPYRFKAGDERCSRAMFLRFARERLETALGDNPAARTEVRRDTPQSLQDDVQVLLRRMNGRPVRFLLDGLDELAGRDERFALDVPLGWHFPGLVWFCSGRPERGLQEVFSPDRCNHVFDGGLPPMGEDDVRSMLIERIGPLRKRLIAQDLEAGERVTNAFVERVHNCAEGLPLYVTYVIGDVLSNRFRALDAGERLPPSLNRYHEELLRRCSVGILHQVVTPMIATVAVAHEPLSAEALADMLVRANLLPDSQAAASLVRRGLASVAVMLRRASTPDGEEGYVLFHNSLRQHMEQSDTMSPALMTARKRLADQALVASDMSGPANPYLFRHGVAHLIEDGRSGKASELLSSLNYLMWRFQTLRDPEGISGVVGDWGALHAAATTLDERAVLFESFVRQHEHLLRRGTPAIPAYKCLLQLGMDQAADSPLRIQAETWLDSGLCTWRWFRQVRCFEADVAGGIAGPASPLIRVLDGEPESLTDFDVMPDDRIVSWLSDGTIKLWSTERSTPSGVLVGHDRRVIGVASQDPNTLLSWGFDGTLRLWDLETRTLRWVTRAAEAKERAWVSVAVLGNDRVVLCTPEESVVKIADSALGIIVRTLEGHADGVNGVCRASDGSILSWSRDGSIRSWDPHSGTLLGVLFADDSSVIDVTVLPEDRLRSCSLGGYRFWDIPSQRCIAETGTSCHCLSDGRVAWLEGESLRLFDVPNLAHADVAKTYATSALRGVLPLRDSRVLSWSNDGTLQVWDGVSGEAVFVLSGHRDCVNGALLLPSKRVLSWGADASICLWDVDEGRLLAKMQGHAGKVNRVRLLSGETAVSGSKDGTMRVWDLRLSGGGPSVVEEPRAVAQTGTAGDDRLWALSRTGALDLWDLQGATSVKLQDSVTAVATMGDASVVACSTDGNLRVWDARSGSPLLTFDCGGDETNIVTSPEGRIAAWSVDVRTGIARISLWDRRPDNPRKTCRHDSVQGARFLDESRLITWETRCFRLWDASTGECRIQFEDGESIADLVPILGGFLASRPEHGTDIVVWNAGRHIELDRCSPEELDNLLFQEKITFWDRKTVLSPLAARIKRDRLGKGQWVELRKPCARLRSTARHILGLASGDGQALASWSDNGTICIWRFSSTIGQEATVSADPGHVFTHTANSIEGVQFLEQDRLLSWSSDGTFCVWDLSQGCLVAEVSRSRAGWQSRLLELFGAAVRSRVFSSPGAWTWRDRGSLIFEHPLDENEMSATWHSDRLVRVAGPVTAGGCVPVILSGDVVGVLQLYRGAERAAIG
jgi:WD40 repeat protein